MKTIKPSFPDVGLNLIHPIVPAIIPLKKRRIKDIVLNVSFKNALIRIGFALFLAIVTVFTDTHLIIYIAPAIFYLFVSALVRFCIIKYAWHRFIKHEPVPQAPKYGKDPNSPEESI